MQRNFEQVKINEIEIDFYGCQSVLTADENYVIISGGYDYISEAIKTIYVLNIKDENGYILKQSSICSPISGDFMMLRSGNKLKDELIAIGYIKTLFKSKQFKMA